jgi:hypothetical protein
MLTLIVDCERYKWQWWESDWEQEHNYWENWHYRDRRILMNVLTC